MLMGMPTCCCCCCCFSPILPDTVKNSVLSPCTQKCKKWLNQLAWLARCFVSFLLVLLLIFFLLHFHLWLPQFHQNVQYYFRLYLWNDSIREKYSSCVHIALLNKLCLWRPMWGTCVFSRSKASAADIVLLCSWRIVRGVFFFFGSVVFSTVTLCWKETALKCSSHVANVT